MTPRIRHIFLLDLVKSLFLKSSFFCFLLFLFFEIAIFCYFFIDEIVLNYLSSHRFQFRLLMKSASLLIFPPFYPIFSLMAFFVIRFLKSRQKWGRLYFEIAITQSLGIAFVRIFKIIIGRARPETFLIKKFKIFQFFSGSHHFHSFPSGHTMAAMMLATSLSLFFPKWRILFTMSFLFLSSSRVFLLNHFPSDLFGTAFFSILIALNVHIILDQILSKTSRSQSHDTNIP